MFTLNVAFGPIAWVLGFNTKEAAEKAVHVLNNSVQQGPATGMRIAGSAVTVSDDFGQTISCSAPPTAILLEDVNISKMLHIEVTLHRARTQHEVQKRAESDAGLRNGGGQRPGIISPFPAADMPR